MINIRDLHSGCTQLLQIQLSTFQDGWGYDFRRNLSVAWGDFGDYATDLFTAEAEKVIERHAKGPSIKDLR